MESKLSELVYNNIIQGILQGEITPETILNQSELSKKYKVSISPVRDALTKLCSEKILYSIPRYGYKVKLVDYNYYIGIIRYRLIIEPEYLNVYFDHIMESDIDIIRNKINGFTIDSAMNPIIYWERTSEFHLSLARAYHDEFFYDELKSILNMQLITFSQLYWNNWGSSRSYRMKDNHTNIIDSIEKHNRQEALFLLRQDIKSF